MARALTLAVFCLCLAISYAADLRRLIAERAAADPYAAGPAKGVEGKGSGDLDTAHSWGGGWGGPWGGFYGGPWGGWGPWGYGYGGGWGYGGYGGYGGFGGGWW